LPKAIATLTAQKNVRLAGVATRYLAQLLTLDGDLPGALREGRAAVDAVTGARPLLGDALAALSDAQRQSGALDEALETAKRAMAALEAAGKTAVGEAAIRLAYIDALRATGDEATAKREISTARDRIQARAQTLSESDLRRGFLANIAENVRTLELAGA
jgi:hypothetical protein